MEKSFWSTSFSNYLQSEPTFVQTVGDVPNRITPAKHYGCDVIVDFTKKDPIDAILKLTGGNGVDSAIEALGSAKTFAACVSVTRPGGTISNLGYHGDGGKPCCLRSATDIPLQFPQCWIGNSVSDI